MKVWIVTKEYWESTTILGVYDSFTKAVNKIKSEVPDLNEMFEVDCILDHEVTYYCPYNESKCDYIARGYDVE